MPYEYLEYLMSKKSGNFVPNNDLEQLVPNEGLPHLMSNKGQQYTISTQVSNTS